LSRSDINYIITFTFILYHILSVLHIDATFFSLFYVQIKIVNIYIVNYTHTHTRARARART